VPRREGFRVWSKPEHGNDAHCNVESEHREDRTLERASAAWVVDVDTDSCFVPWSRT
jgi:hypothetical protein